MAFTQIQKLQLNNQVDRILHTPGNFRGGNLEMTMVFDYAMDISLLKEEAGQIIASLRAHSQVFQNVRFNGVKWKGDGSITSQVIPMAFVQMGKFFEDDENNNGETSDSVSAKSLDVLLENLKLFHARSKLILILTQGQYKISDKEVVKQALSPFLKQKILFLENDLMKTGMQVFIELI